MYQIYVYVVEMDRTPKNDAGTKPQFFMCSYVRTSSVTGNSSDN